MIHSVPLCGHEEGCGTSVAYGLFTESLLRYYPSPGTILGQAAQAAGGEYLLCCRRKCCGVWRDWQSNRMGGLEEIGKGRETDRGVLCIADAHESGGQLPSSAA